MLKGQYAFAKGDVSVGLGEPDALAHNVDLNVWPNPASNVVDIQLGLPEFHINQVKRMAAFDAAGRQVWHSSEWNARIDVSSWNPGLHTLVVEGSKDETWTSSLVVTGSTR